MLQPSSLTAHYRHPEDHHAYQPGGPRWHGKDGRTSIGCAIRGCGKAANAPRHRPADKVFRRSIRRGPQAEPRPPVNAHAFVLGGPSRPNRRGAVMHLCGDPACRKPANAPQHRGHARGTGPRAVPSPSRGPARARAGRSVAPAEYVALAIAVDTILALPADVVGWRLRMRLADIRTLLPVDPFPSLGAREAEPDPEPPTPALAAVSNRAADLQPRQVETAGDAKVAGILRGVRNDRIRTLAKRAHQSGWDVAMTGSGHIRLSHGAQTMILSTTAGDGRRGHSWGNTRAEAKRLGLDVSGL